MPITFIPNFQGKELEQSHEFLKFLEYLKRKKDEGTLEVADLTSGQLGALGLSSSVRHCLMLNRTLLPSCHILKEPFWQ